MVKTYSRSLSSEIVQISNHREPIPIDDVGGYVICQYGGAWWLAFVLKTNSNVKKVELKFMHPAGPSPSFVFPRKDDILIFSHADILMKANPTTTTGRVYNVSSEEAETASHFLRLKCI